MATISEICEIAATNPIAHGHTSLSVRQVWASLPAYVKQCLFQKKSVVIPHFVQFVLQHQEVHAGTWNVRRSWIPLVMVDPTFASQFGLSNPIPVNAAHHSAQTNILLNAALLSELCGQPRDAAVRALKAIVRSIGQQIESFPKDVVAVELDGIAVLEFQNRRLHVRWAPSFLREFEDRCSLSTDYAPKHSSAGSSSLQGTAASGRPSTTGFNPHPPAGHKSAAKAAVGSQHSIPAPPPVEGALPLSAAPLPEVRVAQQQQTESRPITPRSVEFSNDSPASSRRHLSARDRLQQTLCSLPSDTSDYDRRNLKKTLYRRLRNEEDTNSWSDQLVAKTKQREAQLALEREQRERERARITELENEEKAALLTKRQDVRSLLSVNSALVATRDRSALPKSFPTQDIIVDSREERKPAVHDVATLARQLKEQAESQLAERSKIASTAKFLAEQQQRLQDEKDAAIAEKRRLQETFNKVLADQVAVAEAARASQRSEIKKPCSPLFNYKDTLRGQSKESLRHDRERLIEELCAKNKEAALRDASRKREEAALLEQKRQQQVEAYDARKVQKQAEQAQLASDLFKQIRDKERTAESQRSARRAYIDRAILVNESSDDEM